MVNIFGMKLFESPSIEEQMHHKGRHGPNCECPNCGKKDIEVEDIKVEDVL